MPIWLRKFTFDSLKKHFEKENEKGDGKTLTGNNVESMMKKQSQQSNKPPDYQVKAPKK